MKTARWIRTLPHGDRNWWVRQHLFKVSPPMEFDIHHVYRKRKLLEPGIMSKSARYRMKEMTKRGFFNIDPAYKYCTRVHSTSFVISSAADLKSMMEKTRRDMVESATEKKWKLESMTDILEEDRESLIATLENTIDLFSRQGEFEVETYLFPCDKFGNIKDGGELPGSQRGTLDVTVPFRDVGYEIVGMPLNMKKWEGMVIPEEG